MTEQLRFSFPNATLFDRIVAKDKVLKQANSSALLKKLFQEQLEQVRCFHELTEEKMNLASSKAVPKILVIQIFLKSEKLDKRVVETIDKAFNVPIIFEVHWQNRLQYATCYRRRNENDNSKWVFSDYFFSDWFNRDCETRSLPVALSLETLYEQLIRSTLPLQSDEPLLQLINRICEIRKIEREVEKLEGRINKEKQFNRRVELNRKLNELKTGIAGLRQ